MWHVKRFSRRPISEGMVPVQSLSSMANESMADISPISVGRVPVRPEMEKIRKQIEEELEQIDQKIEEKQFLSTYHCPPRTLTTTTTPSETVNPALLERGQ